MANVLGTVKDMEEYKQQYKKQQQIKNRLIKTVKKTFAPEELEVLEIEKDEVLEIEKIEQPKPKREELDEYTLKGLINERTNIQIMQKAEKLYAYCQMVDVYLIELVFDIDIKPHLIGI